MNINVISVVNAICKYDSLLSRVKYSSVLPTEPSFSLFSWFSFSLRPRLVSNSQSSCLGFLSSGITCVCHQAPIWEILHTKSVSKDFFLSSLQAKGSWTRLYQKCHLVLFFHVGQIQNYRISLSCLNLTGI